MTSLPTVDVPGILKVLELQEGNETAALLSAFTGLSDSEKETARASTAGKVFPLVFGEAAAVEGSEKYKLQRKVPWYTHMHHISAEGRFLH